MPITKEQEKLLMEMLKKKGDNHMYEENRNQEFDGNGNPENYRSEEHKPNFIMTDAQEQPEGQGREENTQGVENQLHPEEVSQSQPQPEGVSRPQPEGFTQSQPQSESLTQNQPRPESCGQSQNQGQPERYGENVQPYHQAYSENRMQSEGSFQGQAAPGSNYHAASNNYQGASAANGGYYQQSQPHMENQGQGGAFSHGGPAYQQMSGGPAGQSVTGQPQTGTAGETKGKNGKKRRSLFAKAAGVTAAALLFGTVSGGTMVGINMLADSMKEETYPQVSQSATLEGAAPAADAPAGSGASQAGSALAMDVSAIVENAMPSIVAINNTMLYQSNSWFGMGQTYEVPSSGSGIIVGQNDEELLVVTNNHVVEDSNNLSVVFIDSTSVTAAVKGTDAESDLAVVAVPLSEIPTDTLSQITVAKLGNSDDLKVGQCVIAIGNALGYGQSTTVGWVSALDREVTTDGGATTRNLLQTDAAINPGNSGGALLNMKGEVIGINAAKYSSTDVEGIGYAIPISKAEDIISSLMTKRTRSTAVEEGKEGYLGIQGFTVEDTMVKQLGMPSGVFVSGIIEGGAASKTDLREKDVITKFDDQTVRTMSALQDMLKYYKEGETVTMVVQSLENGQYVERTIEITLEGRATLGEDSRSSQGRGQGK